MTDMRGLALAIMFLGLCLANPGTEPSVLFSIRSMIFVIALVVIGFGA